LGVEYLGINGDKKQQSKRHCRKRDLILDDLTASFKWYELLQTVRNE